MLEPGERELETGDGYRDIRPGQEFLDDYFFTILTMKPEMISRNRAWRMLPANVPDY